MDEIFLKEFVQRTEPSKKIYIAKQNRVNKCFIFLSKGHSKLMENCLHTYTLKIPLMGYYSSCRFCKVCLPFAVSSNRNRLVKVDKLIAVSG